MSKKRSRMRTNATVRPVQNDKKAEVLSALDGFINSLAYLGEANKLEQSNDYERHIITRDFETLTVMYRENWLTKRIIDLPCEDMTRAWYSISSEIEQDKLDEIAKLEAKHNVKQEITNMLRWARLYGGAAAVMVIKGQEDMLDTPLDFDMLTPGCFRGLIVVDRTTNLYPSLEIEEDMDDPEYGYPMYYNVILDNNEADTIRIHHSRILIARGRMLPIQEEINEEYWGASEIEHIYEELQKRNATSANIAQLVFQANVSAMKIGNFGEAMATGTDEIKKKIMEAIYAMNRIKNSSGLLVMGAEDNYEQHPYSFAGIAEVYEAFMMDMAGAAEIPATKLFGRSPQGMNATGESDMNNYYEKLAQLQEIQLRPAIEKLLPVMAMSLWGEIPEDMEIVFKPLATTTPAERAEIMSKQAATITQAFSAGIISQKMALRELQEQGKSIGAWTNITDEDIERADDEFDTGEGMEDPMGMMGPGGPEEGPEGEMPPQPPPDEQEMQSRMVKGPQEPPEPEAAEEASEGKEDRTAKILELKERIQKIREKQQEPEPTDKVGKLRKAVMEAVQNGDYQEARKALTVYKARKLLEEQKTQERTEEDVDPHHSSFVGDVLRRVIRFFRRDAWNESQHPRGKGGKFAPKGSGSAPGSAEGEGETVKSSDPIDNSPKAAYNASKPSFAKTVAKKFRETFHAAKAAVAKDRPEIAWRVDSTYTDKDYEGMDCYTTPGGSAVAVHDGDIVSVCGKPGDKVRGSQLLKHAVEMGGKKLDAFGGLYGFYAKNGFEPVSWCKFDEQYAPDDWVKGRDAPEPVIFWKYTGRSYDEITRDHGKTDKEFTRKVKASAGYDDAKDVRDKSMEG